MDILIQSMQNFCVDDQWKLKFDCDLVILAKHYAESSFENIYFVPDNNINSSLINFLTTDNNARTLLINKIKELYPNQSINISDVDSIIDYYIFSLEMA